jgi:adenine-specific DNA methylase
MKTRDLVTAEKLRGGFYTPPALVAVCLERVRERLPHGPLRVLEPSAGDGAFVRALARPEWRERVVLTAIEPLELEAEKCRQAVARAGLEARVLAMSAIAWATNTHELFDAAVGNPPFVRYQFVSAAERAAIERLGARLGIAVPGVSNLWIPVLLAALSRLRDGGAFAFVVPTECLTGSSASVVRRRLVDDCEEIRIDLFPPRSFPNVLQQVAVLSGRRAPRRGALPLRVVEGGVERTYEVADGTSWTRCLLDPPHLDALDAAGRLALARPLGELAAFEVSIVTGANDYFSVDDATLARYELEPWALPLLPRIRHAPGLLHSRADRRSARAAGAKTWLLDFAATKPDPLASGAARRYLALGEKRGLHARYKCRIREPWYRVPGIVRGELLLSKRCQLAPRVVVNAAESFTTDTIYRGRMLTSERSARDVAAAFHNSLTLLTAELEGRSFGGGVLELVPSEVGRLTALVPAGVGAALPLLDRIARASSPDALVERTDALLVEAGALPPELVPPLRGARERLAARRLERSGPATVHDPVVTVEAVA